jgi:hypothetical protein
MMPVEVTSGVIAQAELFAGRSSAIGAMRGAKLGLIIGAITGAIAAIPACENPEEFLCGSWDVDTFLSLTALSGIYGAGIGAIVRSDRWKPLQLAPPRVSLITPTLKHPRIGLRFTM